MISQAVLGLHQSPPALHAQPPPPPQFTYLTLASSENYIVFFLSFLPLSKSAVCDELCVTSRRGQAKRWIDNVTGSGRDNNLTLQRIAQGLSVVRVCLCLLCHLGCDREVRPFCVVCLSTRLRRGKSDASFGRVWYAAQSKRARPLRVR